MRQEQEILQQLLTWAEDQDQIRAMIMTSSRTNPKVTPDLFSDYDIELFVRDLQPFAESDDWLAAFGRILVHWPAKPTSFNEGWITRLVIFEDGLRIDFQISTPASLAIFTDDAELPADYDNGYRVLLDKDNRLQNPKRPTHTKYITPKPDRARYDEVMHEFWWDITYVAKSLWRDELVFAKWMFDSLLRYDYLEPVIEWAIGVRHNWTANPNKHGRWFKQYLDAQTWADIEATFAGAGIEENWAALFKMTDLFRALAQEVGQSLGYTYPSALDARVTAYLQQIRTLPPDATDF